VRVLQTPVGAAPCGRPAFDVVVGGVDVEIWPAACPGGVDSSKGKQYCVPNGPNGHQWPQWPMASIMSPDNRDNSCEAAVGTGLVSFIPLLGAVLLAQVRRCGCGNMNCELRLFETRLTALA